MIYSLVETAKENGLYPFPCLTYLFEELPNLDRKTADAVDRLLPWSAEIQAKFRVPEKPGRTP